MTKHGLSGSREYETWARIKQRCYNKKLPCYKDYGGRGITMCDEWKESFEQFYKDMGKRPEGKSIDRIDNDGSYEPSNCRWADKVTQQTNRRMYRTNKTGYTGVYKYYRKYQALIRVEGKLKYLGSYITAEEASVVVKQYKLINMMG